MLTVYGNVPSKKNSKRRIFRGGKPFMIPSEAHEAWHRDAIGQLLKNSHLYVKYNGEVIELRFFPQGKHKGDLTNKAESVMDLLVDAGWLEDDNWFVASRINLRFGGVDKDNPRVEINYIEELA